MIKPQDIKQEEFTKVMRGYDPAEVDEHIAYLTDNYTKLYSHAEELTKKLKLAIAKLEEYKAKEQQINKLRIEARDAGNALIATTKDKCAKMMSDAEAYAAQVNADCDAKIAEANKEVIMLHNSVLQFRDTVFDMYGEHINSLQLLAEKTAEFGKLASVSADTDAE